MIGKKSTSVKVSTDKIPSFQKRVMRYRGATELEKFTNNILEIVHDLKELGTLLDKNDYIENAKGSSVHISENLKVVTSGGEPYSNLSNSSIFNEHKTNEYLDEISYMEGNSWGNNAYPSNLEFFLKNNYVEDTKESFISEKNSTYGIVFHADEYTISNKNAKFKVKYYSSDGFIEHIQDITSEPISFEFSPLEKTLVEIIFYSDKSGSLGFLDFKVYEINKKQIETIGIEEVKSQIASINMKE